MLDTDTIVAIATGQGVGGIGVIRLSGFNLADIGGKLLGTVPSPRNANYLTFYGADGYPIDRGIVLYFPAPLSYTGEDVLELQGHGGKAVMQLLLQRCVELGARIAQPGEFTKRAYLNNKIDLAQAESVADLIEANTAEAARSALRSLQGEFSAAVNNLISQLTALRIFTEATLDFPEEDIDTFDVAHREQLLQNIQGQLFNTLQKAQQGNLLREGAHVVLAGRPNVGKSSVLNKLSGEEVVLVSDVPGTTRDSIRQEIQIRGIPLHIIDTAGLRESQDVVENMGMDRTRQAMQKADLIMLLLESDQGITAEDEAILNSLPTETPRILVFNKMDLLIHKTLLSKTDGIFISAKTGKNMEALCAKLLDMIGWSDSAGEGVFMARTRHVQALKTAHHHLNQAGCVLENLELLAEELRLAQQALGSITGKFTADDLLGEIFSRFCIGK